MKTMIVITAVFVLLVVGGGVFLSLWEIPAPAQNVEKVIPDARLSR